jgi:hypothetical protein
MPRVGVDTLHAAIDEIEKLRREAFARHIITDVNKPLP